MKQKKNRPPPLALARLLPLSLSLLWGLLAHAVTAGEPSSAMVYRGKSVPQWAGELGAKDYPSRWYATYALGRMGSDAAAAVPALEQVLANLDEHEYVRGGAAWALGQMGDKATAAVPLLTRTLTSKHVSVRRNSAQALGNLLVTRSAERAKPQTGVQPQTRVQQSLPSPASGEGPGVRAHDAADPKRSAVAADLQRLLTDEDVAVRISAAVALWKIQRHPKAIPALDSLLGHHDGSTACQAAAALGELGAEAEPAVPSLIVALGHGDEDTRRAAAQSLGRIGLAAIPALRAVLAGQQDRMKPPAVEALGGIGPAAADALVAALGDPSPPVRCRAARALGRLGPAAIQTEPALVKAVSDPKSEVRDAAAVALKAIRGS